MHCETAFRDKCQRPTESPTFGAKRTVSPYLARDVAGRQNLETKHRHWSYPFITPPPPSSAGSVGKTQSDIAACLERILGRCQTLGPSNTSLFVNWTVCGLIEYNTKAFEPNLVARPGSALWQATYVSNADGIRHLIRTAEIVWICFQCYMLVAELDVSVLLIGLNAGVVQTALSAFVTATCRAA